MKTTIRAIALAAAWGLALWFAGALSVAQEPDEAAPEPADNSFCLVCHHNFGEEELATQHIAPGVGCTFCHGDSFDHRDDESHRTPPDVLYGRTEVAPLCEGCHEGHKSPERVEAYREEHRGETRPNGRVIRRSAVCTDCHGLHVLHPTE